MFPRLILVTSLVLALPAMAGTPIDETRPLAADGRVSVDNLKGEILVRTWDRPEVHVTGTLGDGVEAFTVSGGGSRLSIEVKYPNSGGGWFFGGSKSEPSVIEVRMPATASLEVDSVSARVEITGLDGGGLSVDSVSGSVRVRDSRASEARFDNVSGDIDAEIDSDDIYIDTVSGDVTVAGTGGGSLRLDTVSGEADLSLGETRRAAMDTVSGDISLVTGLAPGGRIVADSVSGGLRLRLPADASAQLAIETFSGGISSPVGEVQTERYGPGKRLQARLGEGDGEIRLNAFSGDVRVELTSK